jgi:hypothetical protein
MIDQTLSTLSSYRATALKQISLYFTLLLILRTLRRIYTHGPYKTLSTGGKKHTGTSCQWKRNVKIVSALLVATLAASARTPGLWLRLHLGYTRLSLRGTWQHSTSSSCVYSSTVVTKPPTRNEFSHLQAFYLLQQTMCAKTVKGVKFKIIFNLTHKYNNRDATECAINTNVYSKILPIIIILPQHIFQMFCSVMSKYGLCKNMLLQIPLRKLINHILVP